nr:hypothetical protein CFP56_64049 [Quercus suber]
MGGCTHLRMLPKLPLYIEFIDATKCTSLETLSLRPEYDFWPKFRLFNCDKLIKNQGYGDLFSTMLGHFIIYTQGQQAGWIERLTEVDANGFSQIEVKFGPEGPGLEVTKCGAHLMFERDIEDLINQTNAGPSSCIITPYDEDGFENSEKDTKIKQSRDDTDGEGAGPSGEATSNDVDEPHPKRIRLPNLIERLIPRLGNWLGNSSTQEQATLYWIRRSICLDFVEKVKPSRCWLTKKHVELIVWQSFLFNCVGWCIDVAVLYIVWITSRLVESIQLHGSFYC